MVTQPTPFFFSYLMSSYCAALFVAITNSPNRMDVLFALEFRWTLLEKGRHAFLAVLRHKQCNRKCALVIEPGFEIHLQPVIDGRLRTADAQNRSLGIGLDPRQ